MRDKSRIEPLMEKIKMFWLDNQDLRLGQIIAMLSKHLTYTDIFFSEEDGWNKAIDILIENSCKKYKKHDCKAEHGCLYCKYNSTDEKEIPCSKCRGTEFTTLTVYKNNCYYEGK